MRAHTPGPWVVADLSHSIVVRTQSFKKSEFGADRYAAIGGFDRSDPEQLAEAMANANLIAAAPELLEALKEMVSIVAIHQSATGNNFAWAEMEIARAAITNATKGVA